MRYLLFALAPCWASVALAAGTPANLEATIRVDRPVYHPGEFLRLEGVVKVAQGEGVILPDLVFEECFWAVKLWIETPARELYVYDPFDDHPDPPEPLWYYHNRKRQVGDEVPTFDLALRLCDTEPHWLDADEWPADLRLRPEGSYRAWFEYSVHQVPRQPAAAWRGTTRSPAVTWTVRAVGQDERRDPPTQQQQALLADYRAGPPHQESFLERNSLTQELLRAENDGLARAVVDLLRDTPWQRADDELMRIISTRAASRQGAQTDAFQLGIDGTYLKTLVATVIDVLDHPPEDRNRLRVFSPDARLLDAVIAYLKFHPEDNAARGRVIHHARRRRNRKLEKPGPGGQDWASDGPLGPVRAWQVLLGLDVLHPGMTLEEAVAILGTPTYVARDNPGEPAEPGELPEAAVWHLRSYAHVNPLLVAGIRAGRVVVFRQGKGG